MLLITLLVAALVGMSGAYAAGNGMAYTMTGMRLLDNETKEAYACLPRTTVYAEVTLVNQMSTSMDRLLFVQYGPEGQMLDMEMQDFWLEQGETADFGVTLDNTDGRIGSIRALVVPKDGGMMPLSNSMEVSDAHPMVPERDIRNTTWDEYVNMSAAEQQAFEEALIEKYGPNGFFDWLDSLIEEPEVELPPWEEGGKLPEDYTLEEYLNLSEDLQYAFREYFGSEAAFNAWFESKIEEDAPEEEDPFAGMELEDFTFDDYFEMDRTEQAAFCEKYFGGSEDALFDWLDSLIEEPELDE